MLVVLGKVSGDTQESCRTPIDESGLVRPETVEDKKLELGFGTITIRQPRGVGTARPAPADADEQTSLMAFLGRRV